MRKSTGIILVFVSIMMVLMAGCTSPATTNATPQIVYVTVLVTPTPPVTSESPAVTPVVTEIPMSVEAKRDEAFLAYINDNEIVEGMKALSFSTTGGYSISTGYNAASKNEARRLTDLIIKAPLPGSEMMKAFRSEMLDALSMMDGSTAGFSRYKDAMETVIKAHNAALSEMHSLGSSLTDATHLSGRGNDVQWYNTTETGLRTFSMHHTGERNFAVTLKDENDKYISLLANEIGDYTGKKSERLTSGNYYLDITADGDWTISISSD